MKKFLQGNTWLKRNSHTEKKNLSKRMKLEKKSYTVLCHEKNSITRGLGKKLDHVSFGGLSIYVLANSLVDYWSIYRPLCRLILGRLLTDMMATLGHHSLSVNSRPLLCWRIPWSTRWLKCRSTCQSMNWSSGSLVSADCWSQEAASWLIWGWYLVTTVYRWI